MIALLLAAQLVVAQASPFSLGQPFTCTGVGCTPMPQITSPSWSICLNGYHLADHAEADGTTECLPDPRTVEAQIDRAHAICERHPPRVTINPQGVISGFNQDVGWEACNVIWQEYAKGNEAREKAQQAQDKADQEFVDKVAKTLGQQP